ncbi:helix-turn-helix domain-containing protein [Kitasatospora nipponensis]|uniref:Helix-turn-helix domain-containing protein n=1 Tax=Kitasatospora nipponensis TaxID=258049 RepID=A0ABP4GWJ4_9ACTN
MLAALGLEAPDEAVYREMLASPTLGVSELAARLATTPAQVRGALDRLFELRLIQQSFEAPGRFTVVDPAMGLQQLMERQHEELIRRQRQVADSQAALVRVLAAAGPGAGGFEGVERLVGMDAVQRRLERFAVEAAREVLTFMPGGPQSAAALAAAQRNDDGIRRRGVLIRTVGLSGVREDPGTLAYARWLSGDGCGFRTAPSLPTRMILVDGSQALVPLDPADSRRGALCLSDPAVVTPLLALFEQTWTLAAPLGSAPASDPATAPSDQERALLALLAQGHTDESAACQLHISARTARRMMASVIERLGARSRFEAGLRAHQLGWV